VFAGKELLSLLNKATRLTRDEHRQKTEIDFIIKKSVKVSGKKSILINHIYIHIPFCLKKCGYCSFFSVEYSQSLKEKYLGFLLQEFEIYQQKYQIKPITIYFGGGTSSLLSAKDLDKILSEFEFTNECEITLEANPININEEYVQKLSTTPINRISLGVQSFLDKELKMLGRLHDSEKVYSAFKCLRNSGFENISFDLIYGLPNQKIDNVEFSLTKMIELNPEHISTYCLSLEKDVPLFKNKSQIPDDETVARFYYLIRKKMISAGFKQYEISNFAKPGFESKHNFSYWNDRSYLGFGPSASGYLKTNEGNFRYTNPADLEDYFESVKTSEVEKHRNVRRSSDCLEKKGSRHSEDSTKSKHSEVLTEEDHKKEFIFLSLRKTDGINLKDFQSDFGENFLQKYEKTIAKYLQNKYLEIVGDFIRLTPKAYFVSNEILKEFV